MRWRRRSGRLLDGCDIGGNASCSEFGAKVREELELRLVTARPIWS